MDNRPVVDIRGTHSHAGAFHQRKITQYLWRELLAFIVERRVDPASCPCPERNKPCESISLSITMPCGILISFFSFSCVEMQQSTSTGLTTSLVVNYESDGYSV